MWVLEFILLIYFIYVALYSLLFSIAGLFYRNPSFKSPTEAKFAKLAILIPAYKEDSVIINVAQQALNQTYPKAFYDVIIIADSLEESTLDTLKSLDVITHVVNFEKSTKVKSLQSALNTYGNYDFVVVLDADNVMERNFLDIVNKCYEQGWKAIQGKRTAKNKNSPMAILDGISETIGNHINRQGAIALGLSSPIIGSGMAFEYGLLKNIMNSINSVGGFDKELQVRVLNMGHKIYYLKNMIVFDEKVDNTQVFKNQRRRWLSSHYLYLRKFIFTGISGLFNGKISLFNITVLSALQLPRILNLGLLFILAGFSGILSNYFSVSVWTWGTLFVLYLSSFIMSIPMSDYDKKLWGALLHLPGTFMTILLVHFKLKGADKKFIHTPHKQHH